MDEEELHFEIDIDGPEAARANEAAREVVTARTLALDAEVGSPESQAWADAIARVVKDLSLPREEDPVQHILYLVAALSTAAYVAIVRFAQVLERTADPDDETDFLKLALNSVMASLIDERNPRL